MILVGRTDNHSGMPVRRGITYKQKIETKADLNRVAKNGELAAKYGISKSSVSKLRSPSMQAYIRSVTATCSSHSNRCRNQGLHQLEMENELLDWIDTRMVDKCTIGAVMIKTKAIEIRDFIMAQEGIQESRLAQFKASSGWLEQFKRCADLRNKSILRSEDIVPEQTLIDARSRLKAMLAAYDTTDIYNADESGLLYLQTPSRSFIKGSNQPKEAMKQKQRITISPCCSLSGRSLSR